MNILMYDPDLVEPMREELTSIGFTELKTVNEVNEKLLAAKGISMLVVNSVCGCAAGSCRPGITQALKEMKNKPANLFTVFAGQDKEATSAARSLMPSFPPSSPSIAFFKDGKPVSMIHRFQIEAQSPSLVAKLIENVYESVLSV